MALALSPEQNDLLSKLVVVDIAPARGSLSSDFKSYLDAMRAVERAHVSTRKEALAILEEVETVRLLLLLFTNPRWLNAKLCCSNRTRT